MFFAWLIYTININIFQEKQLGVLKGLVMFETRIAARGTGPEAQLENTRVAVSYNVVDNSVYSELPSRIVHSKVARGFRLPEKSSVTE